MRIILVILLLLVLAACQEPEPDSTATPASVVGWKVTDDGSIRLTPTPKTFVPDPTPTGYPTATPIPNPPWDMPAENWEEKLDEKLIVRSFHDIAEKYRSQEGAHSRYFSGSIPQFHSTTIYFSQVVVYVSESFDRDTFKTLITFYSLSYDQLALVEEYIDYVLPEWDDSRRWLLGNLARGTVPAGVRFENVTVTLEAQPSAFVLTVTPRGRP